MATLRSTSVASTWTPRSPGATLSVFVRIRGGTHLRSEGARPRQEGVWGWCERRSVATFTPDAVITDRIAGVETDAAVSFSIPGGITGITVVQLEDGKIANQWMLGS